MLKLLERYAGKLAVLDIEVYPNYFLVCLKLIGGDTVASYVLDETNTPDWNRLRRLLKKYIIVTFNGINFDIPLVCLAMTGATNAELKDAANRIIESRMKPWEVMDALGVVAPKGLRHYDLIEPAPGVRVNLKTYNGRLFGRWMQDLPYDHMKVLTQEEKDFVHLYCVNDLDATGSLCLALQESLVLREEVSAQLDVDVMSKSDTQMGSTIVKKKIEQITGKKVVRADFKPGQAFRYAAPPYIKFKSPVLRDILERIQQHQFVSSADGKVDLPKWLSDTKIAIGPSKFQMGIGGLHSTESNRAVVADNQNTIVSVDVASYYPKCIVTLGLYPQAVGKDFIKVYEEIMRLRLKAKAEKNALLDKTYKLSINGCFGLLGNRWSFLYAPHLLIAVTLTGQLALLMLIERALEAGIPTISANTDGVEFLCPRTHFDGWVMRDGKATDRLRPSEVCSIVEGWERDTGFVLEGVEYRGLYNQSVNSYIALKADGSHKRKGPLSNPWGSDKADYDPRGQLMKNPQSYILSDAVLYFLKNGTPIADTINNCHDVRAFVTVVNATGGATWRDEYLGKVVRYYWAKDGDPIIKIKPHPSTGNRPKVSKTDGCRPIMTLPDDYAVPEDLDRQRYIDEAYEILAALGYGKASNNALNLYLSSFTKSTIC